MVTRVLALLVIAAVAGAAGLLVVSTVLATQHPERSFSPASVSPGTDREVMVTITRVGAADGFAQVIETLPAGFTFKSESAEVADASPHAKSGASATVSGQVVTIGVLAADSVRYTVEVADDVASGSHEFTGTLNKVTGDTPITSSNIMVAAAPVQSTPTPTVAPTTAPVTGPSRSFSPPVLPAGTNREVVVTVRGVDALDGFAQVIETLPAGFSFKAGSAEVADSNPHARSGASAVFTGRVLMIEVLAADSVRYTVMVADSVAAGSEYGFSGVVKKVTGETPIGDTGTTMPMPTGPSRSFSPPVLPAGTNREVVVTITRVGAADGFAQVVETLPAGFTFKDDSEAVADASPHARSGVSAVFTDRVLMIEVLAADSVRYTVMVADSVAAGSEYGFTGVVKKLTGETPIGGTGPTPPMPTGLSRTFAPETLAPGTNRELVVTVSGIGALDGFAQLVDTLPAGFSFKDGSAEIADAALNAKSGVLVNADGQVVMIEVVAADSVRYTVSVADDVGPGSYWFRGVVKTLTREEQIDAAVISPTATPTVVPQPTTATPTVVPQPTRRRSRGGGGGGGGGGPAPVAVATATPMPTRAPVATIAPTPTPIIVPTPEPTIAPTPEPTIAPTMPPKPTVAPTPRPKPTAVIPTVEPTKPPEPTAMPKPTAAPTAVPPTEVPPTAMVEPTEPPAPTATIAPTVAPVTPVTPEEGGMPVWLIIVIIVIVVAVVIAAIGFYLMRMRR